jgi:cytochrome c peroxidase
VFGGNTTPVPLSAGDRTRANIVYDRWAQSIDSYEQSVQVSAFSSKFDAGQREERWREEFSQPLHYSLEGPAVGKS